MSVLALLTWFFAAGSSDYQRGVDALKAGEATTAQQHLEAATAAEPLLVEAHWELGWAYWLQGDFAAAAASWSTVQSLEPTHPEVGTWLPQAQERARLAEACKGTSPGAVLSPAKRARSDRKSVV